MRNGATNPDLNAEKWSIIMQFAVTHPLSSSCLPYCPWLLLRMDAIILESFRWDVDHMKGNTGKKTVFCFPMLYTENHHFAKTGSGQTWGKLHTTWTVFLFSCS